MITILVVDDDHSLRQDICEILQINDFVTIEAANGSQALAELRNGPPDLILCDVQMPEMDGFTLLQTLQAKTEFASIPFIFISAAATPDILQKSVDHGAQAFVSKPFSIDILLETIRNLLPDNH